MKPSPSQAGGAPARIRVLIVEDHQLLAHAFRNLIEADPAFEVVGTAESADAAMRCVETSDPQIVFLDWSLPRHEAEVACRRIRARPKRPRIVALLDDDQNAYRRVALAAGADEAIGKPDFGEVLVLLAQCFSPSDLTDP
ncbi:MAG TPA: response regulator transcription factor [Burkholderiales bacterium]|nr:response regulator transcription factor [Burkholderiales bacterium]